MYMRSLRYEIQRHFLKIRDIYFINNDAFKPANLVFQAMMVKLKQVEISLSEHKPQLKLTTWLYFTQYSI